MTPEEIEKKDREDRRKVAALERLADLDHEQAKAIRETIEEHSAADIEDLVELAECASRLEDLADGGIAVGLCEPVKLSEGGTRSRLLVHPVKVRHLRDAEPALLRGQGDAYAYAGVLVEPQGAHLEIDNQRDWLAVALAVDRQLGKFRRTGRAS